MSNHSKLFSKGSEGCIFIPKIPCKNGPANLHPHHKTKLLLNNDRMNNEYTISQLISKIPRSDEWAITWYKKCKSPTYKELQETTDIEDCLITLSQEEKQYTDKSRFTLLQGEFVGDTSYQYVVKIMGYDILMDEVLFIKAFRQLIKCLEPLFIAIVALNKYMICHHDIKKENVIYKSGKFYLIDFGISFKYADTKKILPRMKEEFLTTRIYEVYPFEYIYFPNLSGREIKAEQEDIALKDYRKDHDLQYFVHHEIFNRDMDHIRFELLEDKLCKTNKPNHKIMISKLDTYSLGMLLPTMIYDITHDLSCDEKQMFRLLQLEEVKPFMDLFRNMTEIDYRYRISPEEAHRRYINLIGS
jgi:serine/threonine protein kinase